MRYFVALIATVAALAVPALASAPSDYTEADLERLALKTIDGKVSTLLDQWETWAPSVATGDAGVPSADNGTQPIKRHRLTKAERRSLILERQATRASVVDTMEKRRQGFKRQSPTAGNYAVVRNYYVENGNYNQVTSVNGLTEYQCFQACQANTACTFTFRVAAPETPTICYIYGGTITSWAYNSGDTRSIGLKNGDCATIRAQPGGSGLGCEQVTVS